MLKMDASNSRVEYGVISIGSEEKRILEKAKYK